MSQAAFAIVLAGGLGRRMGAIPKHQCRLGALSLLEHAVARAAAQAGRLLVSCNDPGMVTMAGVEAVLPDTVTGFRGPLAGMLAGLEYATARAPDATALLSIAVDTPWFPHDLAQRLGQARTATGAAIAVAASGGVVHPVFALWPLDLAPPLRELLESPARAAVRDFQACYRTVTVEWEIGDVDPFMNINTPAELAAAELTMREGKAPR